MLQGYYTSDVVQGGSSQDTLIQQEGSFVAIVTYDDDTAGHTVTVYIVTAVDTVGVLFVDTSGGLTEGAITG